MCTYLESRSVSEPRPVSVTLRGLLLLWWGESWSITPSSWVELAGGLACGPATTTGRALGDGTHVTVGFPELDSGERVLSGWETDFETCGGVATLLRDAVRFT